MKKRLIDMDHTQRWLIEQVRDETQMYCDESLLKKIYEGRVHSERIEAAIRKILNIN